MTADDRVFILRFWREPDPESSAEPAWRARIRFVNTGQQIYAVGVDAAIKIVESLLHNDGSLHRNVERNR